MEAANRERTNVLTEMTDFDVDKAKTILNEIIRTFNHPDNSRQLALLKASAGKETLSIMQMVFPMVMQLQMNVIQAYGFAANREGLLQFAQLLHEMERDNEDIARLRHQIRTIYLPPITVTADDFDDPDESADEEDDDDILI